MQPLFWSSHNAFALRYDPNNWRCVTSLIMATYGTVTLLGVRVKINSNELYADACDVYKEIRKLNVIN